MKFFRKRKDKWTRVYLAGYQQGLHTSYCKNLFCSFDYRTCPNVKSFYSNSDAVKRVREVFSKEIEYNLESDYERAVLDVKKLVLRALDGEQ